ncbi:lytic transglycosylase domain-containing protein [Actinomyces lilanjuaniae]|uniref:lytic transglycosylase domain-containing protein n=1 Tax=Actinomyces lilanjuaniae TaxID=2321394 RepID=UPI0013C4842E|nr:lytic transglycosylase domain-containing protein [Actinomyces lilanjuaniae]
MSSSNRIAVLVLVAPLLILSLLFSVVLLGDVAPTGGGTAGAAGQAVAISGVPSEWAADVVQAGNRCPQDGITAQVIAAQLDQESSWDPSATSGAGAQGLSQFMPDTWETYGVDGDGDGTADPFNGHDAIASQANYMCTLAASMREALTNGVDGDLVDLALAAYNAGPGAVLNHHGVPPYSETQHYVTTIKEAMPTYTVTHASASASDAQQSADDLVDTSPVDAGAFAPEMMSQPDPTPGAHGTARVTPRMGALINDVMTNYSQIVNDALYCWDAHTYNPTSDHPKGRACDIPFYGCSANPDRSADPLTGLAAGNAAANWMVANASTYGVHYVIWDGRIWYASTGKWEPYDGAGGLYNPSDCTGGHYDHIHVSVF